MISEKRTTPGIGAPGEIPITNRGTRAILVADSILTDQQQTRNLAMRLLVETQSPLINRRLLKFISISPFVTNAPVFETQFTCEACLPFTHDGQTLYWVVAGQNYPPRIPDSAILEQQREFIRYVTNEKKYSPQSGKIIVDYVNRANPTLAALGLFQIDHNNFDLFEIGLEELYGSAFSVYPYNVVDLIQNTCGKNVFVVAIANHKHPTKVVAVTGAEIMNHPSGITLAEIGDSAALPGYQGFGALMKRYLMQLLAEKNRLPDLLFTDSRIGQVLKANRMAGLELTKTILPLHTEISSARDPHGAQSIPVYNVGNFITLENMTMTYASAKTVENILEEYGPIPNNSYNQS